MAPSAPHRERESTFPWEEDFPPMSDEDYEAMLRRHADDEDPVAAMRRRDREQSRDARRESDAAEFDRRRKARQEDRDARRAEEEAERQRARQRSATANLAALPGQAVRNGVRLFSGEAGGTLAGTALGFVAVAIAINLLRYGPAGLKDWLKAKFLNETTIPGSVSASPATPPGQPTVQVTV